MAYLDEREGPALNRKIALDVLNEGRDRLEPAFATMSLRHQILEFEGKGQKQPSKVEDVKQLNILFSKEIPTYHVLEKYIQTEQPKKPGCLGTYQYNDWRVKSAYDGEQKNNPYIIVDTDYSRKIITLQQCLHIVIDPATRKVVWKPKCPELRGDPQTIEAIFDEFFKPKQLSEIKENEVDAFLQRCWGFHPRLVRNSH